jgi:hypothetical protein
MPLILFFISLVTTYTLWYLIARFYVFQHFPGYGVFLSPRSWGGIDIITTNVFNEWGALIVFIILLCIIWYLGYVLIYRKIISFKWFLIFLYICSLVLVTSELFFSPSGIKHIDLQVRSNMNIAWIAIHEIYNFTNFRTLSILGKLKYFYTTIGATSAKQVFGGSSHPPFFLLFSFILYVISQYAFPFLKPVSSTYNMHPVAFSWGIIVTLINALLIPFTTMIAKEISTEKIAKFTGLSLLILPSVLMHTSSVLEGIPTVFTALGILYLLRAYKKLSYGSLSSISLMIKYGGLTGLFFTIAAQFTYSHVIPIVASIFSFLILVNKKSIKMVWAFIRGLLVAPIIYFIFEYVISSGTSFYILRAFHASAQIYTVLDKFRPYPMAQVSNFVIMSVMGGILWLPIVLYSLWRTILLIKSWILRQFQARYIPLQYMTLSITIMLLILCIQRTTRLEVERTWIWFFFPVWSLIGVFMKQVHEQLQSKQYMKKYITPFVWIMFAQTIITIFILTYVQDYY